QHGTDDVHHRGAGTVVIQTVGAREGLLGEEAVEADGLPAADISVAVKAVGPHSSDEADADAGSGRRIPKVARGPSIRAWVAIMIVAGEEHRGDEQGAQRQGQGRRENVSFQWVLL